MKKIWGFKLEKFKKKFQNISNKISQYWILILNFFSHYFVTFEVQRGIVDR
jgi:hypothetical protein